MSRLEPGDFIVFDSQVRVSELTQAINNQPLPSIKFLSFGDLAYSAHNHAWKLAILLDI